MYPSVSEYTRQGNQCSERVIQGLIQALGLSSLFCISDTC